MKRYPAFSVLVSAFLATAPAAWAHPGHEGHELTWDFDHLAGHPLATIGCFTVLGLVAWIGWRSLRQTSAASLQSKAKSRASSAKLKGE